jgi:hypothetical protein
MSEGVLYRPRSRFGLPLKLPANGICGSGRRAGLEARSAAL